MDDFSSALDGQIEEVRASIKGFLPQLEFGISISSGNRNYDIHHTDAKVKFGFPNSDKNSFLTHTSFPISPFTQITQNGTRGEVVSTLHSRELDRIEEMREGGDITATIECSFRGNRTDRDEISGATLTLEYTIHASEWNDILSKIGFQDQRAFSIELGADDTGLRDGLRSVQAKLNRAEQTHNNGDYESCIRACRDVIESLQHLEEDVGDLVDDQKWDDIEAGLGHFEKGFLGSLSHSDDRTKVELPLKRDSDFALGITKSYVRFISEVVKEEG